MTDLELMKCTSCNSFQHPARELCGNCLGGDLSAETVSPEGVVLASTQLHYSLEKYFSERLPWNVGSVLLDIGLPVIVNSLDALIVGKRVRVNFASHGAEWRSLYAEAVG